jgi:sec-independent protein translocase protein TatC
MSFWEHLDELRGVIIRIVAVMAVLVVAAFCFMPTIFDNIVLAPCKPTFPFYRLLDYVAAYSIPGLDLSAEAFKLKLVSLELTSQFLIHVSASCWTALVVGFPIIIYFMWSFIAPGLYDHEKQGIHRAFFFGCVMFYLGVAVGYFVVFPLALRFLATYSLSSNITPMISLNSYMDNFYMLILLMGAVFELPLLSWLLGKMGVITRKFFSKYRRHAIVALLITAGLITPTGDPFTLMVVFIPIYALWEFSAILVPKSAVASAGQ